MSYLIINNKNGATDVSYEQKEVAELLVRNLNNYRNGSFKIEHSWNKSMYNKNRPSEAQLWRINQLELTFEKFTGITKAAATQYLSKHMHGGYTDQAAIVPLTNEEKYIMSIPL